jgi:DDE domain
MNFLEIWQLQIQSPDFTQYWPDLYQPPGQSLPLSFSLGLASLSEPSMAIFTRRDGAAEKRFFKRLLCSNEGEPRKIVTDKLRSYPVAHREVTPEAIHVTDQYASQRLDFLGLEELLVRITIADGAR